MIQEYSKSPTVKCVMAGTKMQFRKEKKKYTNEY